MMRKGNQSFPKRRGRKPPRRGTQSIPHPPPLPIVNITYGTTLRFLSNAAFDGAITFQNLLDCLLMATTAVVANDIFYAVRVRKIQLWAIPILGQATTVAMQFNSNVAGFVGDQKTHTDTSMGIEPAYLTCVPGAKTLASMKQVSSGTTAFKLTIPANTVIDVHLSYIQQFQSTIPALNAIVGGAAGVIYLRGLDGIAKAGTVLPNVLTDFTI